MRWIILPAALAMLAGCAATPEQVAQQRASARKELADAIGNRVATGKTDCIDSTTVNGPQVIGNDTVVYRRGGTVYVNHVPSCPALEPMQTLIVEQYGTQLCRNDQFRVLDHGSTIPSAYCRLSSFTKYQRPK